MDLIEHFAQFRFQPGRYFAWDPDSRTITYRATELRSDRGRLKLLHEIGHALLNHTPPTDEDRYQRERDAWDVARVLAEKLDVRVSHLLIARSLKETRAAGY